VVIAELVDILGLNKKSPSGIAPVQVRDNVAHKIGAHNVEILRSEEKEITNEGYTESYSFGAITLMRIEFGTRVLIDLGKNKDYYIIDIPLRGTNHVDIENEKFDVKPGFLSITPPNRHVKFIQESNCQLLTVIIERKSLEYFLVKESNILLIDHVKFIALQNLELDNSRNFVRTVANAWHELKDTALTLSSPLMSRITSGQIIGSLLTTIPNNYEKYLDNSHVQRNTPYYIIKAENFILVNLKEHISIEALVHAANVSERSIFKGFKKYRGQSPMAYVRTLKLNMARKDLLEGNKPDDTVTRIAMKWGFSNLGTFSSLYFKQFLENPSKTLRINEIKKDSRLYI